MTDNFTDRTTVSRHLAMEAAEHRAELGKELQVLLDAGNCSFTTDMWTNPHKNIPYVTVTAHYLNANWEVISKIIFTREFDIEQKKTGMNLLYTVG